MKKLILIAAAMLISLSVSAAQTLTINGENVQKTVVTMTFDGDNVVLTFSDQTSQKADMATVIITFDSTDASIYSMKTPAGSLLDIDGLTPGTVITVYDAEGRKMLTSKASANQTRLTIESLKAGTYIMKAGKQIVKFVKR